MFFWQKKEVLVTFSLNDFNRVKDILAANQIPYDWKTVPDCTRQNRSLFSFAKQSPAVSPPLVLAIYKKYVSSFCMASYSSFVKRVPHG